MSDLRGRDVELKSGTYLGFGTRVVPVSLMKTPTIRIVSYSTDWYGRDFVGGVRLGVETGRDLHFSKTVQISLREHERLWS